MTKKIFKEKLLIKMKIKLLNFYENNLNDISMLKIEKNSIRLKIIGGSDDVDMYLRIKFDGIYISHSSYSHFYQAQKKVIDTTSFKEIDIYNTKLITILIINMIKYIKQEVKDIKSNELL